MDTKPVYIDEYIAADGTKYLFEYFETDSFGHLPHRECSQVYGIAFHGDKIIIVNNTEHPGRYSLVGGGVDGGENPDDSLIREIQEESNMNVLYFQPIGYQKVTDTSGVKAPYYQLRYFCVVKPYGPFVSDPAGDVTEVLEVDPKDYKKYFDWGEKSDQIINRATKLKEIYDNKTRPSITQSFKDSNGVEYFLEYFDADSFEELEHDKCKQVYGVCFVDDKIVIGYGGMKRGWGLIGGSIEIGETLEETLSREIREESNMEVLYSEPIGYQKVTDTVSGDIFYQLRYMCKVKPFGEFVIDGGDGVTEKAIMEIKLIDPDKYKDYFDWGEVGERMIRRAMELHART